MPPAPDNRAAKRALTVLLAIALMISIPGCLSPDGQPMDITFTGSEETKLVGTLFTPPIGAGPFPVIVLLHGAERASRDRMYYVLLADVFLERGIAVFVYDKRGAGDSAGDYETTTYAQLIDDAVAAITRVRKEPAIDSDRVGIFGVSESGWLAPEIAARSSVAFVINKVGSALSVQDTVAWEIYNELLDAGVTEDRAREQVDVYRRIWQYRIQPSAAERAAIEALLDDWKGAQDSQLPAKLRELGPGYVADIGYDPGPHLENLETPMLFLYGTEDVNIPTADCIVRLDELIRAGRPFSYRIFEGEGHELGGFSPWPPFYAFADGFAEAIGEFAERHTAPGGRSQLQ